MAWTAALRAESAGRVAQTGGHDDDPSRESDRGRGQGCNGTSLTRLSSLPDAERQIAVVGSPRRKRVGIGTTNTLLVTSPFALSAGSRWLPWRIARKCRVIVATPVGPIPSMMMGVNGLPP